MNNLLKILVIEDNPGDAALLENMLSEAGVRFELKCVERLFSAIEQIKSVDFDVILLDLGLPDSYGLETLIKLNEVEPVAPVIVLTGLADESIGTESVKAGAQDYLVKGQIDKNLLSRSISHAIERKRSTEALQVAASEWSASFDAMSDSVSIHNVDNTILSANRSLCELLGKATDEMVGKKCYRLFHGKENPIEDCPVTKTINTRHKAYSEIFEPTLNKWLSVSASPVFDSSGILIRNVHAVRDITERKRAEESLRQSEQQFRDLLARLPDVVMIHNEGIILYANQAAIDITGYSMEELVGSHILDYVVPEDRDIVSRNMARSTTGENVADYEIQFVQKSGSLRTCIARASNSVFNGDPAVFFILIDITERKKLEEQLRQSQKMESIGTLAGGIAHDFNNILTAIIGYGNLAIMKMAEDDPQRLNVQHMLEASDRAVHLTKDLLLFSRKQVMEKKPVDLNMVLAKVEKFLVRVIGEDIACKTVRHEAAIPLLADEHQLEQVLMNLATNARDAMPEGGLFTLSAGIASLDEGFVAAHGYGKTGTYALVTATDTGRGMDEATRQRIFEPFFTTKEVGKGTGLGLAVVYGIIKQHDGYVNVYSEPGKGTTFRIYLPVSADEQMREIGTSSEEPVVGGTETILLAEDDEAVRNLTRSVLTEFGYSVITAVDGADAVSKFSENRERIDLILLDLIMPKMNGSQAFEKIRELRPRIKAIFSSGYAPDAIRQKMSLAEAPHLITKPVSPTELLRKVREVLSEP